MCAILPILFTIPLLLGWPAEDFSFVHISDTHLSPHHDGEAQPELRGAATIDWLIDATKGEQQLTPFNVTAAAPSIAIVTGDLTEFGVIDQTWKTWETTFDRLGFQVYAVTGNHDNTWVAIYDAMRKRHGGENYAFDRGGCRFIVISSASPQEPVPTIDGKTRAWLKKALDETPADAPIFVAMHHPPDSNEFAAPIEHDTLIDLLRNYNIALLLYGHGHSIRHGNFAGIDGVMGGSTFGKNSGYGVISMKDGTLCAAYRRMATADDSPTDSRAKEWTALLQKPLRRNVEPRLVRIDEPQPGQLVTSDAITVRLTGRAVDGAATDPSKPSAKLEWFIDGEPATATPMDDPPSSGNQGGQWRIDSTNLSAGMHLLSLHVAIGDQRDIRTVTIRRPSPDVDVVWTKQLPTAFKAAPVVAGDMLIVADTSGAVAALDRKTGSQRWRFETGGEILGAAAWTGSVIVFGSGDGHVYAIDGDGKERWRYTSGVPVYAPPLVVDDTVYVGDNSGKFHALALADGKSKWTFSRTAFAIESRACAWNDLIVFGAWDGYVYALDRATGELKWKALGPKSSKGKGVRYYAPADCSPVVVGDRLYVCDRGYDLGVYSPDGSLQSIIVDQVSAIAATDDAKRLLARTLDDRMLIVEGDAIVGEIKVPAGRFPVQPTVAGNCAYIGSNTGNVSRVDLDRSEVTGSYRATPGWYVMAQLALADDGVCYVAGMDGSLTALRFSDATSSR